MCDSNKNHNHGLVETWVTPETSTRLRSKLVQLAPGEKMPFHTTGPGREEVITCIFGTIRVTRGEEVHTVRAGEAIFIPENTQHAIHNRDEDHALYCYVVSMAVRIAPMPETIESQVETELKHLNEYSGFISDEAWSQ